MVHKRKARWLPEDPIFIDAWLLHLRKRAKALGDNIIQPIRDFELLVKSNPILNQTSNDMFTESAGNHPTTPLEQPAIENFAEFLKLLNALMQTAPPCYQKYTDKDHDAHFSAAGMIGFPINALIDWPMATKSGYAFFSNSLVNQQFKRILDVWTEFVKSPASAYILTEETEKGQYGHPLLVPWLGKVAQKEVVEVAVSAKGQRKHPSDIKFEDIFQCKPSEKAYGFTSWDDFFTRRFVEGFRPVAEKNNENIIINACESAPLALESGVKKSAKFWLKKMPYSLENMLDFEPETEQFLGGTVYQAFLSGLSFHRWHSPVNGVMKKIKIVQGAYFLQDPRIHNDPVAPNFSQKFLSAVATRALMFIEADNPKIGLMCMIAIGMAECSSCDVIVEEGARVSKGQEVGMFHHGGSTHCLLFRPETKLKFETYGQTFGFDSKNVAVNAHLAKVL